MKYGLPYQGSKNRIADKIIDILPPAHTLVDLFAGGCAITHAALLSGKYQRIIANDLSQFPALFIGAAKGTLDLTPRWIDRETFHETKASDPLTALIYSFSNKTDTYAFSREIEPYMHAVFKVITSETIEELRLAFRIAITELFRYLRTQSGGTIHLSEKTYAGGKRVESFSFLGGNGENKNATRFGAIESLERLQRISAIERLQRISALGLPLIERLTVSRLDYRRVTIPQGAIIYADPPYCGTTKYATVGAFDSEAFYAWAASHPSPIFISEYNAPPPFVKIAEFKVRKILNNATHNKYAAERLYANPPALEMLHNHHADLFTERSTE